MQLNGAELQTMTYNGQEVNAWVHNGVEVFSADKVVFENNAFVDASVFASYAHDVASSSAINSYITFLDWTGSVVASFAQKNLCSFTAETLEKYKSMTVEYTVRSRLSRNGSEGSGSARSYLNIKTSNFSDNYKYSQGAVSYTVTCPISNIAHILSYNFAGYTAEGWATIKKITLHTS